jgi:hypothetical protein
VGSFDLDLGFTIDSDFGAAILGDDFSLGKTR